MSKVARAIALREYHPASSLRLCENASLVSHAPGVLCTLEGPIASFIIPTRNNRLYPRALWERLINSNYVQEMLTTLTFYGEADHPFEWEDRLDSHIPEVCINIRKIWLDDAKGAVMAIIDVLDTPNGRIVKTLVDYGSKLGISSRGSGNVIETPGQSPTVDPDTYVFITFDIVAMPGNAVARLTESTGTSEEVIEVPVTDSTMNESMVDAFRSQLNEAINRKDKDALSNMKVLLEYSHLSSSFQDLNESMNHILSEDSDANTISSEVDDLLEAYSKIDELSTEKTVLLEKINHLTGLCKSARDTIVELNDECTARGETIQSYSELVTNLTNDNTTLSESVDRLEKDNSKLNERLSIEVSKASKLNESYDHTVNTVDSLRTQLSAYESKVTRLNESHTRVVNRLRDTHSREVTSLNEKLDKYKSQTSELQSKSKMFLEGYVRLRGNSLGLNERFIMKVLDDSIEDISDADEKLRAVMKESTASRLVESAKPVPQSAKSITYETDTISEVSKEELEDLNNITAVVSAVGNLK